MNLINKCINTLRVFAIETITNAKSGHPGIALGATPTMFALYSDGAFFYPEKDYFNRDRIVLSAGHVSALLYNIFYCLNYGINKNDLLNFRQINSITTGHPETHLFGVEAGAGPLGQGVANAVGMAIAEKHMQSKFNTSDCEIINHKVFAFCGDGCLMEGVSQEALSIAGNLSLDNLIVVYDFNNTTIDGHLDITQSENIVKKYKAMNFNVLQVKNGNNYNDVLKAINKARKSKGKPTLIIIHSLIGYASCFENMPKAHGTTLSEQEVRQVEQKLNIHFNNFQLEADVQNYFQQIHNKQKQTYESWKEKLKIYQQKYPHKFELLNKYIKNNFEINKDELIKFARTNNAEMATRISNSVIFNKVVESCENIMGGCADVANSTKSFINSDGYFSKNNALNRNIAFGVREHAMGSVCNGIALYGGFNTYSSTFFSFSDYMRPSVRMACLQNLPNLYMFTHDSIGAGEDGPTHQPIEHLNSFRLMPNCTVFRPCDMNELAGAYLWFIENKKPTILALTRQDVLPVKNSDAEKTLYGAYVVKSENKKSALDLIIVATGSEVQIALQTAEILKGQNKNIRVVSMPSMEVFNLQSEKYRNKILPKNVLTVSIEAGNCECFKKYASQNFGVNQFGKSGRCHQLFDYFELTAEKIAKKIKFNE